MKTNIRQDWSSPLNIYSKWKLQVVKKNIRKPSFNNKIRTIDDDDDELENFKTTY